MKNDNEVLEVYAGFVILSLPTFDKTVQREKDLLQKMNFLNKGKTKYTIWWAYDQYRKSLRFEWQKIYRNESNVFDAMNSIDKIEKDKSPFAKTRVQRLVEQFFCYLYVGLNCCVSTYDKNLSEKDQNLAKSLWESIYHNQIDTVMNLLFPYAVGAFRKDAIFLNEERKRIFIDENKKHHADVNQKIISEQKEVTRKDDIKPKNVAADKGKYWLAADGSVKCPGDSCSMDCDMRCPIYAQTLAMRHMMKNEFAEAAKKLQKAVEIEPSFADAWNNLAAAYGQMGNHREAYNAYKKSYELMQKPNPLYGMAVATKNMKDYPLAMQFAKNYVSKFGSDDRIKSLMAEISEKQLSEQVSKGKVQNTEKPNLEGLKPTITSGSVSDQETVPQSSSAKSSILGGVRQSSTASDVAPEKKVTHSESFYKTIMQCIGSSILASLNPDKREGIYLGLESFEKYYPEVGILIGQYYQGSDLKKAREHYKIAADAHIGEGEWGYAGTISHSYIPVQTNSNDVEWEMYCLRAAENGCPDAANEIGNICHRRECIAEAAYWYAMAYFLEHPQGLAGVTGMIQEWVAAGKPEGYKAGTSNYTKQRHEAAIAFLKSMTNVNTLDELMTLCMAGETLAGLTAAYFFEQAKHDDMAFKAYNMLVMSDKPHPHALRCCADMMISGKGTEKDVEGALKLYEQSAKGGNAVAMYVMGQKAVKEGDTKLAACWFGMAYARGYELAGESLMHISE